jgi:muconolactone delta-isomerase
MEFLVEFELKGSDGIAALGVAFPQEKIELEAQRLVRQGQLIRLWTVPNGLKEDKVLGLYRTKDLNELDEILDNLPFHERVNVVITRLEPHPNDPYHSGGYFGSFGSNGGSRP